jgi:thiosulfate/3-mercaptopyruvate sulfurtransferase
MAEYKQPEVLVSTDWAAQHLNDPKVRLVEVDVDTAAYDQGHIPGAVGWNWQTQLQDNVRRDLITKSALEQLLAKSGISNDTTVLLYGDNNNWFAAYALWQLKYYGHKDVRLINGGRKKWVEEKRPLTTEPPRITPTTYRATGPDESIRARKEDVFAILESRKRGHLVDVRSVDEFTGKIIAPPGMTETAQRAGHIPTLMSLGLRLPTRTAPSRARTSYSSFTALRASTAKMRSSPTAESGSAARTLGSFSNICSASIM